MQQWLVRSVPMNRGLPPTCFDLIQNGGETGIDCGGPCPPCAAAIQTPSCTSVTYNLTSLQTRQFIDDGGVGGAPCLDGTAGNYCNCNCFSTTVICAAAGEFLIVDFSEFAMWNTASGWDWMRIFDGPTIASPILYDNSATGADNPFGDCGIGATAMDFCSVGQCMTFQFWATSVVNRAEWDANVSSVAIACVPTPLPIELAAFNAFCGNSGVEISWTTISESNNDYFSVQRSTDGIVYFTVDGADGAGNSTEELNYRYFDVSLDQGIQYYRIKQTDFDGKLTYSEALGVDCSSKVRIFPNPTNDNLFIELDELSSASLHVTITDVLGNVISEDLNIGKESKAYQNNEFSNLSPGVYLVRVIDVNGAEIKLQKVVKK